MSKGFIMVSREILNDPMYFSERFTRMQAFTDLCYLASFKEREFRIRGNKVSLKIGQVTKSVRDLSQRWQWSVNTVTKYLKELQEDGYIETQRTSVNQIITIKKYLMYNTQNETLNDTQIETQIETPIINIEELKKEIKKEIEEELANASKKKAKSFVPPTVEEVSSFVREQGFHFDAVAFVNFYESKGWLVGKNKMKDWRAACRTWERKRNENVSTPQSREDIGVILQGNNTGKYDNMKEIW